jgi:hypothetical protein
MRRTINVHSGFLRIRQFPVLVGLFPAFQDYGEMPQAFSPCERFPSLFLQELFTPLDTRK